jgi:hypothetical protein
MALFAAFLALAGAGCGRSISPLQSPVTGEAPTPTLAAPTPMPSPTFAPINTQVPAPAPTPTLGPSPTLGPTFTPGPSPTPDTRLTSESVFLTITALAATPTYPPTSTPRPFRTPIGAGPEKGTAAPTRAALPNGVAVQMISERVIPGGAATLSIKGRAADTCTLLIDRSTASEKREQPIPANATRRAGSDGVIAWIWTVDLNEPAGAMTLVLDCAAAGRATIQMTVTP